MATTRDDLEREVLIGQELEHKRKKHRHLANLNKTYSRPRRYASSIFVALGSIADILSKHALITGIILLVAGVLGFAISPPLGIAIVASIVVVMAITGIVSFILHSQKIKKINQYIQHKEEICKKTADLKEQIAAAKAQQQALLEEARALGLEIDDILDKEKAEEEETKKKADCTQEKNKTFVETMKDKIAEYTTSMRQRLQQIGQRLHITRFAAIASKIGHGILTVGVAVAAAGGIVAGIAAFTGANVFHMGLIAAFAAATGLSGPVGIAIIVGIAAVFIAILLVNKFCFKMPVEKAEKNMKQDRLEHKLEHARAEALLARTEHTNLAILTKINARLKLMYESGQLSRVRVLASPLSDTVLAVAGSERGSPTSTIAGHIAREGEVPGSESPVLGAGSPGADEEPSPTGTDSVSPRTLFHIGYYAYRSRLHEAQHTPPQGRSPTSHTSSH